MIEIDERLIRLATAVVGDPGAEAPSVIQETDLPVFDRKNEIIVVPFLTADSCNRLVKTLRGEAADLFKTSPGKFGAPELLLSSICQELEHELVLAISRYLGPLMWRFWRIYPGAFSPPFFIRYSPGCRSGLPEHHDFASDVSLSIALNADFTGGGLYFSRQDCFLQHDSPGTAIIFPGKVTHLHRASEVTAGCRYVITAWCRHMERLG